tara:strand:- start:5642 stop:6907 length:1266 start_codon:yes stop_codon:yes gene_type:complete
MTNKDFTYKYIGDFKIDRLDLIDANGGVLNITHLYSELNIYENIFSSFVTGNILLIDTFDLPQKFPIVGEERLKIKVKTPGTQGENGAKRDLSLEFEYVIYKISDRKEENDKTQSYVLHFVSPEMVSTLKSKVSVAYDGRFVSDIVSSLVKSHMGSTKKLVSETTKKPLDYIVPNVDPVTAINMLTKRAESAKYTSSSYVFFETQDGFNFVTLENLVSQEPVETYHRVKLNTLNPVARAREAVSITDHDMTTRFDTLSNLKAGMYQSHLISHDMITKRITRRDWEYSGTFNGYNHLGKNRLTFQKSLTTDGERARFYLIPDGVEKKQDFIQLRNSAMMQLSNIRFSITVPGSMQLVVGDTIRLEFPTIQGIVDTVNKPDKYLTGKYLIAALRHKIDTNAHVVIMEIVKDSFDKPLISEVVI